MDVTEHRLSEALLSAEKHTLEMIAGGAPLPAVLDVLCETIEEQSPGSIATVLTLDSDGHSFWPSESKVSTVAIEPGDCSSMVSHKTSRTAGRGAPPAIISRVCFSADNRASESLCSVTSIVVPMNSISSPELFKMGWPSAQSLRLRQIRLVPPQRIFCLLSLSVLHM